ncbi:pentapeptide repeat-containing protein [uncultured Tateyamaria sp.]|uniref:pentapeptide repeat-containing protein n=1 Tax=uncultured Tateyamaria sp. TaxID=455651 RepID=UPI002622D8F1|nr:pentapeptide repeat-containing protein [uncultured Tateyamaria sp.]
MRTTVTALVFVTIGMMLGVGAVFVVETPTARDGLQSMVLVLCGLGLGIAIFGIVARIYSTNRLKLLTSARAIQLLQSSKDIIHDPEVNVQEIVEDNRTAITVLVKTAVGFVAASQAMAYVAMALGGVVAVSTLLVAYVQIERMDQQNKLIQTQNVLAEASRRASLNFELTAILDQLTLESKPSQQLLARARSFSRALQPYRRLDEAGNLTEFLSPERGQLLSSLAASGVELRDIVRGGDFSYADAENVSLARQNLSGANFQHANLADASFDSAVLRNTDFRQAILPPAYRFRDSEIFGWQLEGAIVPSDRWLYDMVNEFSQNNQSSFATPRPKNHYSVRALDLNRPLAEIHSFQLEGDTLESLLRWGVVDQQVQKLEQRGGDFLGIVDDLTNEFFDPDFVELQATTALRTQQFFENRQFSLIDTSFSFFGSRNLTRLLEAWMASSFDTPSWLDTRQSSLQSDEREFAISGNFSGVSPGGSRDQIGAAEGTVYSNVDFSYADLRYVNFSGSILSNVSFHGAWLPSYDKFQDVDFQSVNFDGAFLPMDWPETISDGEIVLFGIEECAVKETIIGSRNPGDFENIEVCNRQVVVPIIEAEPEIAPTEQFDFAD